MQRASRFNVQLNTIIDLSDTRPSCNLSLHVNHNSRGEDKSFQAIDCAIVDKLMRLTCIPFNSLKHCTRSSVLHAAVCRQPTAACTDCRCLSAASVTGQLADTPTRGLPTRGLSSPRVGNTRVGVSASCPVTAASSLCLSDGSSAYYSSTTEL